MAERQVRFRVQVSITIQQTGHDYANMNMMNMLFSDLLAPACHKQIKTVIADKRIKLLVLTAVAQG